MATANNDTEGPEIMEELNEINKGINNLLDSVSDQHQRPATPIAARKWNIPKPETAIIIAISSRALFDLREERKVYEENGLKAYIDHMISIENKPLKPGSAFSFVAALENINLKLLELNPNEKRLFDVVLMSNNPAQVGVALINSINHHQLTIERICLTASRSVVGYLKAYGTDLYLSADDCNVIDAIQQGVPAATLYSFPECAEDTNNCQLRIAFDGDAVLFSDEAEIIVNKHGVTKFFELEHEKLDQPLDIGPLHKFAVTLGEIKKRFHENGIVEDCPIRTYLVTARPAASSGLRALKTLRLWGLDIDEALFLAGAPKGPILETIRPHLFFDDQRKNVDSGLQHGVNSAHVPYGVSLNHDKSKCQD